MTAPAKNSMRTRQHRRANRALAVAPAAAAEHKQQMLDETRAISKVNLAFDKNYANRNSKLLDG